jgi:hypothetical protein
MRRYTPRMPVAWWFLFSLACSRAPHGRVEDQPVEPWKGDGYAMNVPSGASVRALDDRLAVDAADGSRWYDVRVVRAPESAQAALQEQANATCDTIRWDRVATPTPGTTFASGLCPIRTRRHWLLAVQEVHGDATLLTVYVASADFLTFEDAWVDFVRTAATLAPGDAPLQTPDPAATREKLREVAGSGGIGHDPVPGGGELSPRMAEALAEVWQRKLAAGPPRVPGS